MSVRLAIVGSRAFTHASSWGYAEACIRHVIEKHEPHIVISGGAEGIDSLAAKIAREYVWCASQFVHKSLANEWAPFLVPEQLPVAEWLPENRQWEPNGYKARNTRIAEDCTHLLAIRDHASKSYGSGWTADYAESIGRTVRRIIL